MSIFAFLAGCGASKASDPTVVAVPMVDAGAPVASSSAIADAGVEPKVVATAAPEVSECEAKPCTGAVTKDLESALSARARKAHRCYDTALAKNPTLQGKVTLQVRLLEDGFVCRSRIGQSSMGEPGTAVAECMAAAYKDPPFPAPKGGCVEVNIPISLTPMP